MHGCCHGVRYCVVRLRDAELGLKIPRQNGIRVREYSEALARLRLIAHFQPGAKSFLIHRSSKR